MGGCAHVCTVCGECVCVYVPLLAQDCKRSGVVCLLLSPSVLAEVVVHGLSSPVDRVGPVVVLEGEGGGEG